MFIDFPHGFGRKWHQELMALVGRCRQPPIMLPGSGDDGVDVRVWDPDGSPGESPLCIVQCKRQKKKIEKVVVKGLHADVQFERAQYGVIVTTSELSPGAKTTISARGYDIQAVERDGVKGWLTKLRTPGTGIVR